jgi:hypothetical protein
LSKKVCEAWQWKQTNGELRDMVCRGLLLMLAKAFSFTHRTKVFADGTVRKNKA